MIQLYIYMYLFFFSKFFSLLGYYRILSRVSCAMWSQVLKFHHSSDLYPLEASFFRSEPWTLGEVSRAASQPKGV